MQQFADRLHPDLPPTTLWGYGAPGGPFKHLGGAIIARKNRPVRIKWRNNLPPVHPLPVDPTPIDMFPNIPPDLRVNRAAPHLHGGLVPLPSDGGPNHWFGPDAPTGRISGPSVVKWLPDNNGRLTDMKTIV